MKSAERFIEYFGTNSSDARNDVRARYESFAAYAQVAFEGKRGAMKHPIIWYCKEDAFLKASGLQSSCAVGGVEKATAYGMLSVAIGYAQPRADNRLPALFNYGIIVNVSFYHFHAHALQQLYRAPH
jgi:hypothetical protein